MKTIKKVSVTPIKQNEGTIIDSLNSGDDPIINAPSIHAVNEGLGGKANSSHTHTKSQITDFAHNHDDRYYTKTQSNEIMRTVQTATKTATKNDINFTLRFKRNMNVVTLNVEMFVPSTVTSSSSWLLPSDFTMPEWAKTSDNTVINLDNTIISGGYSLSGSAIAFNSVAHVALSRASSNDYRLMFLYAQADNVSYPDGQTIIGNLKYIVID